MSKGAFIYVQSLDDQAGVVTLTSDKPLNVLYGLDTKYNTHVYIDGIHYLKNGV